MRNKKFPPSKVIYKISSKIINRNNLIPFFTGSLGLFIIGTQISHLAADRLQANDSQTQYQRSKSPSQATVEKNAVQTAPAKSEIEKEKSGPTAICEKETGKIASASLNLDAQTGHRLASHVETRYKVSASTAREIVTTTISLSKKNDMDPYLAIGIIASESSFNHRARSGYGATGLMQVYAPIHKNVLEDLGIRLKSRKLVEKALTEHIPLNVAAGIRIYKTYEKQYGSPKKALQAYNGAKQDTTYSYANKVLAMQEQLRQVASPSGACA